MILGSWIVCKKSRSKGKKMLYRGRNREPLQYKHFILYFNLRIPVHLKLNAHGYTSYHPLMLHHFSGVASHYRYFCVPCRYPFTLDNWKDHPLPPHQLGWNYIGSIASHSCWLFYWDRVTLCKKWDLNSSIATAGLTHHPLEWKYGFMFLDFVQHRLYTFLILALIFRTSHERAHV